MKNFGTIQTELGHRIENRKPNSDFRLQRMEDIFAQANGAIDFPHRHDYYTVLLVRHAEGQHNIDYNSYKFNKQEIHFVSPGQVHQVAITQPPLGWVITFSRSFLAANHISESFLFNINLFNSFGESPPVSLDSHTFERLLHILQEMEGCIHLDSRYRDTALASLLNLFLIYSHHTSQLKPVQMIEMNAAACILRDFKNLIDRRFTEWHKVTKYASELTLSAKHLSQTVKNTTGKSAKQFIQERIVLEAKRLLLHSEFTIKEIAYKLGFEEPLYFSSFFKTRTGFSPSSFRKTNKYSIA